MSKQSINDPTWYWS